METTQHLTNNLIPENKNLEVLKAHFGHCFDKQGNFLMEKFQVELQAGEVNFSKESYGLDWLGRSYARLLASDAATTLLKEDVAFNQKPENAHSQNLLLKGDNLEILKHLSHAYHEKVKMIYIDPPYNTGGDGFVYQDDRKFTVTELQRLAGVSEEKAKRILDFTMSKSNSHSAWLTFMYPRLYIAKQLLKDDGVIFVSIDDNEVAQLRLLMDEVFGEENFVAEICHKSRASVSNDKIISPNHNFILLYAKVYYETHKTRSQFGLEPDVDGFNKSDENGEYKLVPVDGPGGAKKGNPHYTFEGVTGYWRFSESTMREKFNEGLIVKVGKSLQQKYYKSAAEKSRKTTTTWWDQKFYTSEATKKLSNLLQSGVFETPKPVELILKMLTLSTSVDDLILDFFAGSGTTGDAVMQLNAEDGGRRKFILAQLPEKIDPDKSKASYDFVKNELGVEEPTIFEITKERLIRAANKLREERPVEVAGQDLGFKVFETMPLWEDYHHKAETLEEDTPAPFRGDLLGVDDLQALFITWKTYDGSPLTEEAVDCDLGGYVGKYVNGKLYLMDKGFTTDHLVALLQKVDADPEFNPRSVIVFESNFQSKNLLELAESLKNFQNQKSLEIDFIMRF
ncbi:MAG: site-specific DNA-methyltransferase [Verrucomicrobia bacterium]|nr:MAG: site-specific DNA-methyltransferase [Verrucomicrobiota bacterium]